MYERSKAGNGQSTSAMGDLAITTGPTPISATSPDALDILATSAVEVHATKNQSLATEIDQTETLYWIRDGIVTVRTDIHDADRIVSILYPGDVYRSSFAPVPSRTVLRAQSTAVLSRASWPKVSAIANSNSKVFEQITSRTAMQMARQSFRICSLGILSGPQRLAALLIELALRTGRTYEQAVTFEQPLCRADTANYLALNADTLSRIVSRFKADGIITSQSRDMTSIRDLDALYAQCPLTDELIKLHSSSQPHAISV